MTSATGFVALVAGDDAGRPAVSPERFDTEGIWQNYYDPDALLEPLADEAHRAQDQSLIMHPGTSHAQSIHIAKNLKNRFSAIEPRSMSTLRDLCRDLDAADGTNSVRLVLAAAEGGLAKLGSAKGKLTTISQGERPHTRQTTAVYPVAAAGLACADSPTPQTVSALVDAILELDGLTVTRRQFWIDLKETLRLAAYSRFTYTEAFETLRSKRQRSTNRPAGDIVARPVLVKGLEFNNVLVLEADKLGTREL